MIYISVEIRLYMYYFLSIKVELSGFCSIQKQGVIVVNTIKKKPIREEKLLKALGRKKYLRTHEAAEIMGVSECTVRRFFNVLQERGDVVRVHGGIKLTTGRNPEYQFEYLQLQQSEQKQRIGDCASKLVHDGDIIFLDSGTTTQQMAISLAQRLYRKDLKDVSIFTNSLKNLMILENYCEVNLIGGLFRSKHQSFCGYLAEMILGYVSFEKCFLGADGINPNPNDGVMTTDIFNAKMNQIVSNRSRDVILLADSTKFMRRSLISYTKVETLKMIITDVGLSEATAEVLEELGPQVVRI